MPVVLSAVAGCAYLLGSIPFGLLIGLAFKGVDIRKHGSGNIGATNAARVLGNPWGILALVLDLLKGLLPILGVSLLFGDVSLKVLGGIAAIVGHMFPVWLKFRGGKGVATSLGVVLVLSHSYWVVLAALLTFIATFGIWRIVSVSSMTAALAYGVSQLISMGSGAFSNDNWSLAAFSIAIPVLIIARHRSNIVRLLKGTEPRFERKEGNENAEGRSDGDLTGTDGSVDEDGTR